MNRALPSRPADRLRLRLGLPLLLLAALSAGCSAARGVGVADLLPRSKSDWNQPLRFTRGPGVQFNADLCPAAGDLVYVWDREGRTGIWLQDDALRSEEPPRQLAPADARDRWPRLDARGRRLLFVSTRQDSAGDIWMLSLRGWPFAPSPQRLTGADTADDQPCWHPDGDMLFYASSPALGEAFDIWQLQPGKPPVRLTEGGGQMPDCSPDGRYLVFVSTRETGRPALWLLRLSDRAVARLTSAPGLDLYPCWSTDGGSVFFARIELDTNGDGRVDRGDASAIFSVTFSADACFAATPAAAKAGASGASHSLPTRQLTPFSASASFPRPLPGGFLYTAALEGGGTGIFALGTSGQMPDCAKASDFLDFARQAELRQGADPHMVLMAWQNVLWAARSAWTGGAAALGPSTSSDPASADLAGAEAGLHMGRILLRLGHSDAAARAFESLVAEHPDAHRFAGPARVELLALERAAIEDAQRQARAEASAASAPAWQAHLERARTLEEEFDRYAREAQEQNRVDEAAELRSVCALARLEAGRARLAASDYAAALEAFDAVRKLYPEEREAGARAVLAAADVQAALGQSEALKETYLKVVSDYADLPPYAAQAAALAVDILASPSAEPEERLAALRDVVERQGPATTGLAALAQNRVGDLLYQQKDYLGATSEYERTVEKFPGQRGQVAAAFLAIGRIRTEQQDYERAADNFRRMEAAFEKEGGDFYERARRGSTGALLMKAHHDLDLGDVALALDTYAKLLSVEPGLAAAHRGLVECYARLGRVEDAILLYRPRVEKDPRDHQSHYALALAYSYYGPDKWVGSSRATSQRVSIDREALGLVGRAILTASNVPYYHQLRGFLLNRLAVATGDVEDKVRALDAYLAALGTSSPQEDPANYPNALFNVGEGYMLVDQPQTAYEYYRKALAAGFDLAGTRGEAALIAVSRAAMAAGDYAYAVQALSRALDLMRRTGGQPRDAVQLLRLQAETLDRTALACQMNGEYLKAVDYCRQYVQAIEGLLTQDAAAADAYRRNLLRAHRNLAVNLCLAVQAGAAEPQRLAEAYALLKDAMAHLEEVGVVQWQEDGGQGLITVDVDVALGERKGPAQFDVAAEKRLIYTYMARISAAAGDYADAVDCLTRKLALYPKARRKKEKADLLAEQAVVCTQMAEYELGLGDLEKAAEACRRALDLEAGAGDLPGEAAVGVSLGRIALRMAATPDRSRASDDYVKLAIERHQDLLRRLRAQKAGYLVQTEAELSANLASLLQAPGAQENVK
jgi:tetratricopeptide (TPR) repeat protein